jgi:hypothetical protein
VQSTIKILRSIIEMPLPIQTLLFILIILLYNLFCIILLLFNLNTINKDINSFELNNDSMVKNKLHSKIININNNLLNMNAKVRMNKS